MEEKKISNLYNFCSDISLSQTFHFSLCEPTFSAAFLSLSLLQTMSPSDITLPPLNPLHIILPNGLCGMGCQVRS